MGLWLAAGGSALVALTALALCAALLSTNLRADTQISGKPSRDTRYDNTWFHTAEGVEIDAVSHPFYYLAAPEPVSCDIPSFDPTSEREWETFTDTVGPCLNDLWLGPLKEMGLRPEEPEYTILDEIPDHLRDSSGEGVTLAYYTEHNLTIAIVVPNVRRLLLSPEMADERIWFSLVAHEYGHHVQGETGLLDAAYDLERDAEDPDERALVGRQIELQAECFAGTGVAGIAGHDAEDVSFVNRHFNAGTGDSDSHGSAGNRVRWFSAGATGGTMQECNTFDAEPQLVR